MGSMKATAVGAVVRCWKPVRVGSQPGEGGEERRAPIRLLGEHRVVHKLCTDGWRPRTISYE